MRFGRPRKAAEKAARGHTVLQLLIKRAVTALPQHSTSWRHTPCAISHTGKSPPPPTTSRTAHAYSSSITFGKPGIESRRERLSSPIGKAKGQCCIVKFMVPPPSSYLDRFTGSTYVANFCNGYCVRRTLYLICTVFRQVALLSSSGGTLFYFKISGSGFDRTQDLLNTRIIKVTERADVMYVFLSFFLKSIEYDLGRCCSEALGKPCEQDCKRSS